MKSLENFKIIILALAFVSISFFVSGCSHTPEAKAERIVKKIDNRLDLNAQQRTELEKLKEEALADMHSFKAEHEAIANEVQRQLETGKLDRAALKKMAAEERNKRAPTTDKWIDNIVTFHEGLNEKQKEIVLKDMKKLRSEMHE